SSYNIYMFGGYPTRPESEDDLAENRGLDEVWVLSMPSFKWFLVSQPYDKYHSRNPEIGRPGGRMGHTCHAPDKGNRTMFIIGGDLESNQDHQRFQSCDYLTKYYAFDM